MERLLIGLLMISLLLNAVTIFLLVRCNKSFYKYKLRQFASAAIELKLIIMHIKTGGNALTITEVLYAIKRFVPYGSNERIDNLYEEVNEEFNEKNKRAKRLRDEIKNRNRT